MSDRNPIKVFENPNRLRELAGVTKRKNTLINEEKDERLDVLDQLRMHLSDSEILEELFGEILNDDEAEEFAVYIGRMHDLEIEFDI